jgi:hypothetical protein
MIRKVSGGYIARGYQIPSDDEFFATFRRLFWVLYYWINGIKACSFINPILVDPKTGESIYGYKEVIEKDESGALKHRVVHANKVSRGP